MDVTRNGYVYCSDGGVGWCTGGGDEGVKRRAVLITIAPHNIARRLPYPPPSQGLRTTMPPALRAVTERIALFTDMQLQESKNQNAELKQNCAAQRVGGRLARGADPGLGPRLAEQRSPGQGIICLYVCSTCSYRPPPV